MADVLVFEFATPEARQLYERVNGILGVDPSTGEGDWPDGLESHVGGEAEGKLIVVEVWASKADQEDFMQNRLGPALHEANVPEPSRVEWFEMVGRKK